MPYEMVRLLNSDHPYRYDGTLFGGTKLWTPSQLTTALWLDADSPSSITLNGTTVSQWSDKSGNGRHATQATTANQPTYTDNGLNGKPVLTFSTDSLSSTANVNGLNSFTMYIVAKSATLSDYRSMLRFQDPSSKYFAYTWSGNGVDTIISEIDALAPTGMSAGLVAGAWNIGALRREQNQYFGFASYNNGSFVDSRTTANVPFESGSLTIGSYINSSEYFAGSIAEIVIAYTAHDVGTRQRMEGYLAWKWGLQASLPVSHPYYSAPPLV